MPSGVFKITDIPEDKVKIVRADFELDDPISIDEIDQGGGMWTVVATFPGEGETEKKHGK